MVTNWQFLSQIECVHVIWFLHCIVNLGKCIVTSAAPRSLYSLGSLYSEETYSTHSN